MKTCFEKHFKIGSAVKVHDQLIARPQEFEKLLLSQFNSVVAENCMKWDALNPRPGKYNFVETDKLVEFAHKNNLEMVGHVLFWHNQNPSWLFKDKNGETVSKNTLIKRMENHVKILSRKYGNKIQSWDVVNEAINEDGSIHDSPWKQILGENWIQLAFK